MKKLLKVVAAIVALAAVGVAVLLLFFSTPEVSDAVLRSKYAQPPSQFLTLPSGTVAHFRDYAALNSDQGPNGDKAGPVIVLVHGSNASLHTWEPWAHKLQATLRVVTVDLPGHGLTGVTVENDYSADGMVAFLESFTRKLGLDQAFVLAGNSMGGHVAWRYTIAHPDRVSKLVLVDSGGVSSPDVDSPMPLAFKLARNPITSPLVRKLQPRALFEATLKKAFYDQSLVTPEMVDRYWELNRRHGTPDATIARFKLPRVDAVAQARLNEIKVPTLVLWGREDALIPVALANVFSQSIAQSKVIIYDRCGHIPMEELADRSAADVRAFVESK
jgi:pimeloyl-ACP methyl ester carboxylesterase